MDPRNRQLIKAAGTVVWLRAEVDTLADRVASGAHRPLLGDDPESSLRRLEAIRRPIYSALADLVVDTDVIGADLVADRVATMLKNLHHKLAT